MDITAAQLDEWIRQNFFAELNDSEFGKQIAKAKDIYVKVRLYFEENALTMSLDSLDAVKSLVLSGETPPTEVKAAYGEKTAKNVDLTVTEPTTLITLQTIDEKLSTLQKRAMWALIALFIIILIK